MEVGKVYEARLYCDGAYASVRLQSGEWSSDHYVNGFFERVEKPISVWRRDDLK
jgi:hypothetical protein